MITMILAAIETQFLILILLEISLDDIFSIKSPEIICISQRKSDLKINCNVRKNTLQLKATDNMYKDIFPWY